MESRVVQNTQLSQGVTIITQKLRLNPCNAELFLSLSSNEGEARHTALMMSEKELIQSL
jgi:hypothetical protein